jgi:hypothetical protein
MALEWRIESEYAEALAAPTTPAGQAESAYAEALAAPPPPAGQGESVYAEILVTLANMAVLEGVYAEFLVQMEPVTPPTPTGHVYESSGALRPVYRLAATLAVRNLVANPSIEVGDPTEATDDNTWWLTGYGPPAEFDYFPPDMTITRSTDHAKSGAASLKVAWAAWGFPVEATIDLVEGDLVIGQQYTAQLWVWVPSGSPDVRLVLFGWTSGSGTTIGTATTPTKGSWVQLTHTFTATKAFYTVGVATATGVPAPAGSVYVDAVSVIAGATPLASFFDGGAADTTTDQYEWAGTPHRSKSDHNAVSLVPVDFLTKV